MLAWMWRVVVVIGITAIVSFGTIAPAAGDPDPQVALNALLGRTDAIAREVAALRGLPLKHPIANEVVDRAELHARLVKLAADHKTAADLAAEGLAAARWGL